MLGQSKVNIKIGDQTFPHLTWVANIPEPCLLGMDFLRTTGCVLDLVKNTVLLGHNHLYTLVSHRPGPNGEEGPKPTAPIRYEPQELGTIIKPPTEQVPPPPSHHTTADVPPLGEMVRDQAVEETVRLVMEQNQEGLTETQQRQLWDVIYEHVQRSPQGQQTWAVHTYCNTRSTQESSTVKEKPIPMQMGCPDVRDQQSALTAAGQKTETMRR
ncbi:hypothetical protein DPEC_G00106710 [Dallia pectoralis]|uniref:Uncharacterized protein n=1 Tax=Dallia pectoralis TaxID=75939 RepID=A0ACC2GY05_DALPE|nr:hypothetical protein DPEC_G00106710 [Dallia pectoralis]